MPPSLIGLVLLIAVGQAGAAFEPRVLSSSRQGIDFALDLPEPAWRAGGVQGLQEDAWEAVLPGFASSGHPGGPRALRTGGWILLPPGTSARLETLEESWQRLTEVRPLAIEPVPVMRDDPATGGYREEGLIPEPGLDLPWSRIPAAARREMELADPALQPGPAVRLGDPVWWRGRRIVAYTVLPLRIDGEGRAHQSLRRGRWQVRFEPDPQAEALTAGQPRSRRSARNDERFAGIFLNGDLLAAGLSIDGGPDPHSGPKVQRPRSGATTLGYPEVRIPVRRSELLRIRASELQAAGLLPQAPVRTDQLRLYQRRYLAELDDPQSAEQPPYLEIEVPIHVVAAGEEFTDDALFLFWGLRPRDDSAFTYVVDGQEFAVPSLGDAMEISNENNIYWLQFADPRPGADWARMQPVPLPASTGTPETSYRRTDYLNEALVYREKIPTITSDRYYYNRERDRETVVALNFWSAVPGQADARLEAGLANFSNVQRTYRLDLVRGETELAELPTFASASRHTLTYETDLPAEAMTGEAFSLRLRSAVVNDWINGYLDWIRVHYDALYTAPFGRLLFPGGDGLAVSNLEIPGFTSNDIGLIEITDPRNPRFVTLAGANVPARDGGFVLSLQIDQSAGPRRFFAAERMTSNGVPDIRYGDASLAIDPVAPTRLAEAGADVLVVVHPEFRGATESWIEYRRSRAGAQGLTFHVVETQDLFDWYTGGLKDPWAIKRLVDHALTAWGSWALVLVGSANENPREIGVLSSGRQWSRDWVPTHFHVQDAGSSLAPEVLASDKWFASQTAGDPSYPDNAAQPTDLYVGRIPVHTPGEMLRVLTKIQHMELAAADQTWRRRAIFIADDAYSTGALGGGGSDWGNQSETGFEISETTMASVWEGNTGQYPLQADLQLLRPFMNGVYPPAGQTLSLAAARSWCRQSGAPESLVAALGRGGLLAHFQGHANHWLMTHETWFEDDRRTPLGTRDLDRLTNVGRPWLFCGMACHLGDFIQNVAGPGYNVEPGLGEKLLLWTDAGAVAVYASSGYEYLMANMNLSEAFVRRLAWQPPHMTVDERQVTSRWLLGELMWSAEADLLAQSNTSRNRQMVSQYVLLGDPLLRLDAGPPQIEATLVGDGPLPELQADLVARDASGLRQVELRARDEAGVDRLFVLDSTGQDLTSAEIVVETPLNGEDNRQIIDYQLTLPVRPFPHDILVRVYDSASVLDSDGHALLTLRVEQEAAAVIAITGEPIDPAVFGFVVGEPVPLELTVTSAAWLTPEITVALEGESLVVTNGSHEVLDNHTLLVRCTVTVPDESAKMRSDRGLNLTIDGYTSYIPLETGTAPAAAAVISRLVNYPNPMGASTRFVFASGLQSGRGRVRVWTVSGREVASVPFALAGGGSQVVDWDGRDRYGDRLANGTYLYRVELQAGQDSARSGMQRLVIMR